MVAVPGATPPTMPDATPIVATLVGLLVHAPPIVPSVRLIVIPTHTPVGPEIAPTCPFEEKQKQRKMKERSGIFLFINYELGVIRKRFVLIRQEIFG
jgi:hypothetical protein